MGDALGFARQGLSRRIALKLFGRPPLRYGLLRNRGMHGYDTQLMFIAAQAMLNSRGESRLFRRAFQRRLSWHLLSCPVGIDSATLVAALKSWFYRLQLPSGVFSAGNTAATRAMFCALAIHGTGNRRTRWVEEATMLTHTHPMAIECCRVLALLTEIAATIPTGELDASHLLAQTVQSIKQPELRDAFSQLQPFLEQHRSPAAVARHFGWKKGISRHILSTTIMASYCWLRFPGNYRRCVESAIMLGGDTGTLAAVAGGLVGAHVGADQLPPELLNRLGGFPQGLAWMEKMAERLSHWPHGVDDLHHAPCQPSEPMLQVVRNLFAIVLVAMRLPLRLPDWLGMLEKHSDRIPRTS